MRCMENEYRKNMTAYSKGIRKGKKRKPFLGTVSFLSLLFVENVLYIIKEYSNFTSEKLCRTQYL